MVPTCVHGLHGFCVGRNSLEASAATNVIVAIDLLYQHSLGDFTKTYKGNFMTGLTRWLRNDVKVVRDWLVMYLPLTHT